MSIDVIKKLSIDLVEDIEFLEKGMSSAKRTYEEKLEKSRASDNLMMKLAWDVAGYEQLIEKAKEFQKDLDSIADELKLDVGGVVFRLQKLEKNLLVYYKELFTKKRNPASHLLVFYDCRRASQYKTLCYSHSVYTHKVDYRPTDQTAGN